jgi:nitrogen fixation/metabolism regulation signal transduction histidine kinase
MAYEHRTPRRSRSAVGRARLNCLLLALPAPILAGILLYEHSIATPIALLSMGCLLVYLLMVSAALIEGAMRPLQTLSNVISSLREGDYSFRACGAGSQDALGELAGEVNALADLLQKQRVHSLEATALLASILEVMSAPLFAFDRNDRLQLVNHAGVQMLGKPHARCFGSSARELGLEELLTAPDQTIHAFKANPSSTESSTRWLLRKANFRQDGAPHTLLLLADVSLPLQEEEQRSWKRLIRVLGHELSNSLAPIKSIAGSMLARVDSITGDEETLRDFRRGMGVIASRADALHRFVQSYRQLAQLPPPQLRPVELGPLLERVVVLQRGGLAAQIPAIQLDSGPAITLHADPDQLEQMTINLLANAVDAALGNGALPVRIAWQVADASVLIVIEDRGLGIANSDNLFVPFYTTKPSGSGVGLALAQQIARAHGGEISLLNREDGIGARATVRLPIARKEVSAFS